MIVVSLMQRNQAAAKRKRMAGNATVGNTPAPVAASPLHPPAQPQPFMVQVPPNMPVGSPLQVQDPATGQVVTVQIPPGVPVGQCFSVTAPVDPVQASIQRVRTAQSAATHNPRRSGMASIDSGQAAMCAAICAFLGFLLGVGICLYAAYGYDVHDYFDGC